MSSSSEHLSADTRSRQVSVAHPSTGGMCSASRGRQPLRSGLELTLPDFVGGRPPGLPLLQSRIRPMGGYSYSPPLRFNRALGTYEGEEASVANPSS
mgnify:CR=1 FL=1